MRKKLVIVILNFTIIFLATTLYSFGQEKPSEIKDKRITIKMDRQPLAYIFEYLIVNYDVAIGFEESILDRTHNDYDFETNLPQPITKKLISTDGKTEITITGKRVFEAKQHWFTVNAENERLEDVLNNIVGQMRNYKWEVNDDVVNIFPSQGRDKRYEELLKLNINNFNLEVEGRSFPKGKPIFLIRTKLFESPEIINFLNENKIGFRRLERESVDNQLRKLPEEINFSNLTLKDLLNKITRVKRGGWILKKNDVFGSNEKEYIEINI